MVVVNPYLKKKKPTSSGGAPPALSAPRPGSAAGKSVVAAGATKKLPPQHVTPGKHAAAASRPALARPAVPQNQPHKISAPKGPSMVTPGKAAPVNNRVAPPKPNPSSSSAQKRPPSAGVVGKPSNAVASAKPKSSMIGRMPLKKGGGSLKQQLKQEIAMLKKQKQLKKLQKEAEGRRGKMMAEKEEKDRERQVLLATMDEERKQKHAEREQAIALHLQEQHRKKQERLVLQERKQEEKRLLEQIREQREEELWQQHKRQAEFKYQQELQVWKYKHQLWSQQQQQLQLQMAQQPYQGYPYYGSAMPPFHHPNHFNMMAWNLPPPPPPPRPPVLVRKPQRNVTTYAPRKKASDQNPHHLSRLCEPMQSPSPFAQQGRRLVTVSLVRNPATEPSYGVNLILHKVSALVDPEWLDAQEKKEASLSKVATSSTEEVKPTVLASTDVKPLAQGEDSSKSQEMSSNAAMPVSEAMNDTSVASTDVKPVIRDEKSSNAANTEVPANPTESEDPVVDSTQKSDDTSNEATRASSTDAPIEEGSQKEPETVDESKESLLESGAKDEVQKVVVQEPTAEANVTKADSVVSAPVSSTDDHAKRKRRRRVNFAVMLVREAEKQNSRQPNVSADMKLQAGDIVIAIGNQDLSGMTFADACKVFSSKADKVNDSLIQTKVVVARKKTAVATPSSIASNMTVSRLPANTMGTYPASSLLLLTNDSMEFSPPEIAMLANSIRAGLHSRHRMIGKAIPDSVWEEVASVFRSASLAKTSAISNRSSETLKKKWQLLTRMKEFSIADKARQFWAGKFREDFGEVELPFSSYVEQCALRQAARGGPRPAKGCRCGKPDHEYLFDTKCLLYADLRKRLSSEELEEMLPKNANWKLSSKEKKALNAVSTANQTRMLKLKEATEKEEAEDRFVARMEEIQVKELKKAIYAPNLSSIVLSAISELQREFPLPREEELTDDEDDEDEMDEDDDVPLVSLGKREATAAEQASKKQQKVSHDDDPKISLHYLVRLVEYISKTWGHCYREPAQLDYAWRWEVFHGTYSSDQQWDAKSVSPRQANSLPFENFQFGLTASKSARQDLSSMPDRIKKLEDFILSQRLSPAVGQTTVPVTKVEADQKQDASSVAGQPNTSASQPSAVGTVEQSPLTPESLDQFCLAVHYLSPAGSGLYEEILALLKMEVLKVRSGIPVFTRDFYEKTDVLVLDDMTTYWSSEVDPDGKYCINEEFRDTLEEKWIKYDYGWALADYPKELIFEYGVLDEWKETFEDRLEENENRSEGIGRFGL